LISTTFDYHKHQSEIINIIINFIYDHLCIWRNGLISPCNKNENDLTADLSKFLELKARNNNLPFIFSHQEPQGKGRTVDISAYPYNVEIYNEIIIVFECKRLTNVITGKRKDEYITGHKKVSGGIQRFKMEVHGQYHKIVGMIGYMQTGTFQEWKDKIREPLKTDFLLFGFEFQNLSYFLSTVKLKCFCIYQQIIIFFPNYGLYSRHSYAAVPAR